MITEERLKEIYHSAHVDGWELSADAESAEILRLARLGLEYQDLIDQENGKANVLKLIELGRRAKYDRLRKGK